MSDLPIRILQISYGMDRGGAETLIMNIYRNIDRDKVQFDFLLHNRERTAYEDEIESLGGRIHHIPRFLGYNRLTYDRNLRKFLQNHPEYTIIHDHLMDSAAETFRVAKKLGRITIAHSHIAESSRHLSDYVRFLFRRNLHKVSDYRFACSRAAGEWLYRGKADFTVLNNGIDTEKYRFSKKERNEKRKELNLSPENILITNIGRMVEQKNQKRLIDIFALFRENHPDSTLMIVGTGPLEDALKKEAEDRGVGDSVIFTGERSDVPSLLAASDIFLFPSLFEGLGIVLVEAQAEGLPCVFSSNIPGEVDLVPDLVTRIPLEAPDEEWAEEINKAAEKREGNREGKYLTVKNNGYDIKESAEKMEKFYLSLSSRHEG